MKPLPKDYHSYLNEIIALKLIEITELVTEECIEFAVGMRDRLFFADPSEHERDYLKSRERCLITVLIIGAIAGRRKRSYSFCRSLRLSPQMNFIRLQIWTRRLSGRHFYCLPFDVL